MLGLTAVTGLRSKIPHPHTQFATDVTPIKYVTLSGITMTYSQGASAMVRPCHQLHPMAALGMTRCIDLRCKALSRMQMHVSEGGAAAQPLHCPATYIQASSCSSWCPSFWQVWTASGILLTIPVSVAINFTRVNGTTSVSVVLGAQVWPRLHCCTG